MGGIQVATVGQSNARDPREEQKDEEPTPEEGVSRNGNSRWRMDLRLRAWWVGEKGALLQIQAAIIDGRNCSLTTGERGQIGMQAVVEQAVSF